MSDEISKIQVTYYVNNCIDECRDFNAVAITSMCNVKMCKLYCLKTRLRYEAV